MSAHNANKELFRAEPMADPGSAGTITVDRSPCYVPLTSAAAETRTLAVPTRAGAVLTLGGRVLVGSITLTVTSGYDETGNTVLTFTEAGQAALFVSVEVAADTFRWRLMGADAVRVRYVSVPDAAYQMLASNSGKTHVIADVTADRTLTFPAEVNGMEYEFLPGLGAADGHDWIFDTGSNTNFFTGGVVFLDTDADDTGDEVVLAAPNGSTNSKFQVNLPQPGTRLRFICNGTTWNVSGQVVSTTAPTYADQ